MLFLPPDWKKLATVFLSYALVFILLFAALLLFLQEVKTQSETALAGKNPEQWRQQLAANPEIAVPLFEQIMYFILTIAGGVILFLALALLLFSLLQQQVWKQFAVFLPLKKWAIFHLVAIFPLALLAALFLIFKPLLLLFSGLILSSEGAFSIFSKSIDSFFLLFFLLFYFILSLSFSKTHKAWASVGEAFHLLASRWRELGRTFLRFVMVGIILQLILYFLRNLVPFQLQSLLIIFLALLLVSWMQISVSKISQ